MATEMTHPPDNVVGQVLEELRGRLMHAIVLIEEEFKTADDISVSTQRTRLYGKLQGARLALSYVDETIREGRWRPGPGW